MTTYSLSAVETAGTTVTATLLRDGARTEPQPVESIVWLASSSPPRAGGDVEVDGELYLVASSEPCSAPPAAGIYGAPRLPPGDPAASGACVRLFLRRPTPEWLAAHEVSRRERLRDWSARAQRAATVMARSELLQEIVRTSARPTPDGEIPADSTRVRVNGMVTYALDDATGVWIELVVDARRYLFRCLDPAVIALARSLVSGS